MSRSSTLPTTYATIGELERGLLVQVRRFRRAVVELAAIRPIVLNAPTHDGAPEPISESVDHRRLELLRSQIILLRNMSAQIITNFPGEPRARDIQRRVDQLCESISRGAAELRGTLSDAARKRVDRTVVTRNHALMQHLQKMLGKSVGRISESYLIGTIAPPGMRGDTVQADVAYIRLQDLRGPDGFTHDHYYLVTAHPREPGNGRLMDMYVTAGPEYRTPARLRWLGGARKPNELVKVCTDLLLGEGVIGKSFERDLPVAERDVTFVHDNVKKTVVKGQQIIVTVKNADELQATRAALRRQLTGIVHGVDPRNRDVIRDRVDAPRRTIVFTFSLPGSLRGRVVDPDVLRRLGVTLDLDDATLKRVRTAIENPE